MLTQYRIGNFEADIDLTDGLAYSEGSVVIQKPYSLEQYKFVLQFSKKSDYFKYFSFGLLIILIFFLILGIIILKNGN